MLGVYISTKKLSSSGFSWINFIVLSNKPEDLEACWMRLFKGGKKLRERKLRIKRVRVPRGDNLLGSVKCIGYVRFRVDESWRKAPDLSYILGKLDKKVNPVQFLIP